MKSKDTIFYQMTIQERYRGVIDYFLEHMPHAATELNYNNNFELLVAVMLSAQCTDKRVNMVTPALMERFPTPEAMANASEEEVFEYISSVTYPNSKSKSLVEMSQRLVEDFDGEVPSTIEELETLRGVGRKTANVVASVAFNIPAMPVDTHVFRVANRIGLAWQAKTPLQVEKQLVKHIPSELLSLAHHWLILHGRYVCTARSPKCSKCGITEYCREFAKKQKNK